MIDKKHSILSLLPLFDVLQQQDIRPEGLLSQHGIQLDSLSASSHISLETELSITQESLALIDDPMLGVKLGKNVTITSYSLFAMLLLSAPSFKTMLDCVVAYQRLSLFIGEVSVHYLGDVFEVRTTLPEISDTRLHTFVADRDFAGIASFLGEVTEEYPALVIACGIARPEPQLQYKDHFFQLLKQLPEFDQPYSWIRIPISILKHSSKYSNELVHKLHRAQAQEAMRKLYSDSSDLVSQIKVLLEGYFSYPYPNQSDIAVQLGLSESTLRRQLTKQGTSYRRLLEQHRINRAKALLITDKPPLSDIADKLGYADAATFAKAFKKWTQITPKQFALSLSMHS